MQPLTEYVQVAHATEFRREPFQFRLEMFAPLAIDEVGNRSQLAAQPPGRCAQAMHSLRLAPASLGIGRLHAGNGRLERRADQFGGGILRLDHRQFHGGEPDCLHRSSCCLVTLL